MKTFRLRCFMFLLPAVLLSCEPKTNEEQIIALGGQLLSGWDEPQDDQILWMTEQFIEEEGLNINIDNRSFPSAESEDWFLQLSIREITEPVIFLIALGEYDFTHDRNYKRIQNNLEDLLNHLKSNYTESKIIILNPVIELLQANLTFNNQSEKDSMMTIYNDLSDKYNLIEINAHADSSYEKVAKQLSNTIKSTIK